MVTCKKRNRLGNAFVKLKNLNNSTIHLVQNFDENPNQLVYLTIEFTSDSNLSSNSNSSNNNIHQIMNL